MARPAKEKPGVEVTVQVDLQPRLYVIAPSHSEADRLSNQIDHDNVTVMGPPKKDVHISRKPKDCEMLIDLRDEDLTEVEKFVNVE